ncbi:MAG: matrixin family metalloprotease [Patescibacteria group bacterium]
MKKFLKLLLFAVFIFSVVWYLVPILEPYLYYSYCDKPVAYKIGQVDPAFNVAHKKLAQELQAASSLWNLAYSKPLIVFDPQSSLSVNLIYDERQRNLTKLYQAKEKVKKELTVVEAGLRKYETDAASLNTKVNQLNKEISDWNNERRDNKGSASEKEYKRLTQEIEKVNSEIAQLAKQRQEANKKVSYYNDLINQYNLQVAQYADILKNLPEEGLYDPLGDKIDIYFYDSAEQFLHTAAHEFGHAIGFGHAQDENSIMYPISNASNQLSEEDLDLMNDYCQRRSVIEELIERGRVIITRLNIIHNVIASPALAGRSNPEGR